MMLSQRIRNCRDPKWMVKEDPITKVIESSPIRILTNMLLLTYLHYTTSSKYKHLPYLMEVV